MKRLCLGALLALGLSLGVQAQKYEFTPVVDIESTEVKSQGKTGTCWSFSTTSFLESEVIRLTGKRVDLSEMYTVRNTYVEKAYNYLYRQGKAQFSQGGLAHDVINSVEDYGLVPRTVFSGLDLGQEVHNHAEMVAVLKSMLDTYIKNPARTLSPKWKMAVQKVLDVYLGANPKNFTFQGKEYTPESFAKHLKIVPENYVTLSSFANEPLYKSFILSIPDNFSNGSFYNVSVEELVAATKRALENGYTIALDCDVSEKTFSSKAGVAIVPASSSEGKKGLKEIVEERTITPELRQAEFENFHTTDDHLMHIVGIVKDQRGTVYFKVKNSWGSARGNGGYIYMSVPYFKLKTISVLMHKDALSKPMKQQLKL